MPLVTKIIGVIVVPCKYFNTRAKKNFDVSDKLINDAVTISKNVDINRVHKIIFRTLDIINPIIQKYPKLLNPVIKLGEFAIKNSGKID